MRGRGPSGRPLGPEGGRARRENSAPGGKIRPGRNAYFLPGPVSGGGVHPQIAGAAHHHPHAEGHTHPRRGHHEHHHPRGALSPINALGRERHHRRDHIRRGQQHPPHELPPRLGFLFWSRLRGIVPVPPVHLAHFKYSVTKIAARSFVGLNVNGGNCKWEGEPEKLSVSEGEARR